MHRLMIAGLCCCLLGCASYEQPQENNSGGPLVPQPIFPTQCVSEEVEHEEDCLPIDNIAPASKSIAP